MNLFVEPDGKTRWSTASWHWRDERYVPAARVWGMFCLGALLGVLACWAVYAFLYWR